MYKYLLLVLTLCINVNAVNYTRIVENMHRDSLIQYLPMQEASGTTPYDSSGNGRVGLYYQVTLNRPGFDADNKSVKFNGTTSAMLFATNTNGYSAALNRDEGSQMIWFYSDTTPNWGGTGTSGTKVIYKMYYNNSNLIQLGATNTNLTIHHIRKGVTKQYTIALNLLSYTGVSNKFMCLIITWSKANNRTRFYINGSQIIKDTTFAGWDAGALSTTVSAIGESDAAYYFNGYVSHMATWKTELTPKDIDSLSLIKTPSVVVFGNSIAVGEGADPGKGFIYQFCYDMLKTPFLVNSGRGGTILQNTLSYVNNGRDRFKSDVFDYHPKIVVIEYCINDMASSVPEINLSNAINDYTECIDSLKLDSTNVKTIIMHTLTYNTAYGQNAPFNGGTLQKHMEYNDSIRALSKRKGCKIAEVWDMMNKNGGATLLTDGVHPNNAGHYYIAKADSIAYFKKEKKKPVFFFNFFFNDATFAFK